ncbi:MAG: DUF5677 domain-containing protein [Prosthecobacter sp.]
MNRQLFIPHYGDLDAQSLVLKWTSFTSELLHELTLMISPHVGIHSPLPREETDWMFELNSCCHLSSESILILTGNMKLWDADALVRSVQEGTVRFIFLCHGNNEERRIKLYEYGELMPLFSRLKRHRRARSIIECGLIQDPTQLSPFKDLLISAEEADKIENQFSKKERKRIEQRWSFTEICNELQRSAKPYVGLGNLLHYYGMSSHVLHQDRDGTAMVLERMRRDVHRRDAVELAHAGRMQGASQWMFSPMAWRELSHSTKPIAWTKPLSSTSTTNSPPSVKRWKKHTPSSTRLNIPNTTTIHNDHLPIPHHRRSRSHPPCA